MLSTASDHGRAPDNRRNNCIDSFLYNNFGGPEIAFENLQKPAIHFIQDVLQNWNISYINGTSAFPHYVSDVFGTLGGRPNSNPRPYKDYTSS